MQPDPDQGLRSEYGWAIEIIVRHFRTGLQKTFDRKKIQKHIDNFRYEKDPVYARLLQSSGRDLYETFIGFWKLGQTLATQSRFWLEQAICEIVRLQRERHGTEVEVYSLRDLPMGKWNEGHELAFIGDESKEWTSKSRAFRIMLSRALLDYIDLEVGRQERRPPVPQWASPTQLAAAWQQMGTVDREIHDGILRKVAEAPWGEIPIQCNLLVVEPEPGRVWAIRYINDKALGRAEARREKMNILRVFGWLCQEKVLRRPERMTAVVAELLPRWNLYPSHAGLETGPEMFSASTWWSHEQLWKFIGVPYSVVEMAIDDVGQTLRGELMRGLATILPGTDRPQAGESSTTRGKGRISPR